jgi:hypothetical protein
VDGRHAVHRVAGDHRQVGHAHMPEPGAYTNTASAVCKYQCFVLEKYQDLQLAKLG